MLVVVLVDAIALVGELAPAVFAPVEALTLRESVIGSRACVAKGPKVSVCEPKPMGSMSSIRLVELEALLATLLGLLAGVTVDAGFLLCWAATAAVAAAVVGERSTMSVSSEVSVRRPIVAEAAWISPHSWTQNSLRLASSFTEL